MYVTYNNDQVDFEAAVNLMDDGIREALHAELAPCTEQEFFDAYCNGQKIPHLSVGDFVILSSFYFLPAQKYGVSLQWNTPLHRSSFPSLLLLPAGRKTPAPGW